MKLPTILSLSLAVALATATPARAWTEHPVYVPAAGSQSGVISIAMTALGSATYIVFEVQDTTNATHTLYLQKWDGAAFWAAPVVLHSHVGQWIYNPSIAARTGHVTVSAHAKNGACLGIVTGLREYDYNLATGLVETRTMDGAVACEEVGHSHLVYSNDATTYHACWTRKSAASGDEVLCAYRFYTSASWTPPVNLNGLGGTPNNQDHATVAIKSGTYNMRRIVFHDQTANLVDDDNEARLFMTKPNQTTLEFRVPDAAPLPQPGWQDRPFIALSLDNKMHVTWEDGPTGSEVIKYVRCMNDTPDGCDDDLEWQLNNVAISEAGVTRARFPHLHITGLRTWISYEQQLPGGQKDVAVLHRCTSALFAQAWTLTDPTPLDTRDEYTEEYGTPHIASRVVAIFNPFGGATIVTHVGTVTLRYNAATGYYDGMLYEMIEPLC